MVILIRYGELSLKGQLRRKFENVLISNISRVAKVEGIRGKIRREWGRLYFYCKDEKDERPVAERISFIFGVVSTSPALECKAEIDEIVEKAEVFAEKVMGKSFAVRARRSGEHEFTSMDVARAVGQRLRNYARVNLKNPEVEVFVEVRDDKAYIFSEIFRGFGGLPVGTQERVLADNAVSAWFALRRGCDVDVSDFDASVKAWACYRKVNPGIDWRKACLGEDYPAVFCSYGVEDILRIKELRSRKVPVFTPLASEKIYTRERVMKILNSLKPWNSKLKYLDPEQ